MNASAATPGQLGYRMPPEWDRHAATWMSWPRPEGQSFPGRYDAVLPVFGEIVRALAPHEPVQINVGDAVLEAAARAVIGPVANVRFHHHPTDEPWCRDHGPMFVKRGADLAIVNWEFNGWGGKYPHAHDNAVQPRIARQLAWPLFGAGMVLEGGSIDVNGTGLLLTTESCLLNPNRNPRLTKFEIERALRDYLGVTTVLWLGNGLVGDDTDGHVDDLARFVNPATVVTVVEEDPQDVNYAALQDNLHRLRAMKEIQRIVELPMPGVVEFHGQRLPASYANFYIANEIVLLPTYRHPNDARAQAILQSLFPNRRVVPLDSTALIWGRGSFHCLTQQQPAT